MRKAGRPQAALDQIVENGAPGFGGFAYKIAGNSDPLRGIIASNSDPF